MSRLTTTIFQSSSTSTSWGKSATLLVYSATVKLMQRSGKRYSMITVGWQSSFITNRNGHQSLCHQHQLFLITKMPLPFPTSSCWWSWSKVNLQISRLSYWETTRSGSTKWFSTLSKNNKVMRLVILECSLRTNASMAAKQKTQNLVSNWTLDQNEEKARHPLT